ncbi:Uncharacterized protein PBTT_01364 [Plasmodiophora brassicae]
MGVDLDGDGDVSVASDADFLSSALEMVPASDREQKGRLLCARSDALMKAGMFEEAERDANDAIEATPTGLAFLHRRRARNALRRYDDAARDFDEARRLGVAVETDLYAHERPDFVRVHHFDGPLLSGTYGSVSSSGESLIAASRTQDFCTLALVSTSNHLLMFNMFVPDMTEEPTLSSNTDTRSGNDSSDAEGELANCDGHAAGITELAREEFLSHFQNVKDATASQHTSLYVPDSRDNIRSTPGSRARIVSITASTEFAKFSFEELRYMDCQRRLNSLPQEQSVAQAPPPDTRPVSAPSDAVTVPTITASVSTQTDPTPAVMPDADHKPDTAVDERGRAHHVSEEPLRALYVTEEALREQTRDIQSTVGRLVKRAALLNGILVTMLLVGMAARQKWTT